MFMLSGNAYGTTLYLGCDTDDPIRVLVDLSDKGEHFTAVIMGKPGAAKVIHSNLFEG